MTLPIEPSGLVDEHDARILEEIRELFSRVDPVPASLAERMKYAMTVTYSEVGEKVDSTSFIGSRLSLMVSLTAESDGVRVDCWVTHGGALVEVHVTGDNNDGAPSDEERREMCDEHGRCVFTGLPTGPAHFIVWPAQDKLAQPIITPTINLQPGR